MRVSLIDARPHLNRHGAIHGKFRKRKRLSRSCRRANPRPKQDEIQVEAEKESPLSRRAAIESLCRMQKSKLAKQSRGTAVPKARTTEMIRYATPGLSLSVHGALQVEADLWFQSARGQRTMLSKVE